MADIKTLEALWEREEDLEAAERCHFGKWFGAYSVSHKQADELKERLRKEIKQIKALLPKE